MFQVGDIVVATANIKRKDGKSWLKKGECAKVTHIYETVRAQILAIDIQDRLPMIDIVCYDMETPLKPV